ncbi:translation initiation factor IF-2 [Candidatus Fermentibacterales bacterium]|nr:translation initiation factor IF-2 [Candidatus Fermentibacterales bacterium]
MALTEQGKKRVYELARELNISSEALIKVLSDMGIQVKSHMSTLTTIQCTLVRERFDREKQKARIRAAKSRKKRKAKRKKKTQPSAETVKTVKSTLARIDAKAARTQKKRRRRYKEEKQERHEKQDLDELREKRILRMTEFTSPSELAELMGVHLNEVISKCLELGTMATANQRLDMDTLSLLADEFGFEIEAVSEYGTKKLEERRSRQDSERLSRPPVVTIMGHVDHGKTALLDHIRSSNIIATESGGITQHIGAYTARLDDDHTITFIDTPGHAAFTSMRTRGAQVTDIVVLVVAADSRVMPQTEEAIDHARAAGVPIVVAITKMDLSSANPDHIKQDLANHHVLVEDWGGEVLCAEVSSITGEGVQDLLEKILLQAEVMELGAYPDKPAKGTVLEGKIDPRRGTVTNVLIQDGTLRLGDYFVVGQYSGRVRVLHDENENRLEEAGPGMPAQILGASGVPEAGDSFYSVSGEQEAREIEVRRQIVERERDLQSRHKVTLEEFWKSSGEEGRRTLRLVMKGDVQGSVEALVDMLTGLGTDEVGVEIVRAAAGGISESDVMLAAASDAVIIGFRVRPDARARELLAKHSIEAYTFRVIYEVEETIRKALSGLLKPEEKEEFLGSAEVRQVFRVPKVGSVAGCFVVTGVIRRAASARLVRDGVLVWEGSIGSLKHFQEDRKEMAAGFECGIGLAGFDDVKVGDIIECFDILKIARQL